MNQCLLCGRIINVPVSLDFLLSFRKYQEPIICKSCQDRFELVSQHNHCQKCGRVGKFHGSCCSDCQRWRQKCRFSFRNRSLYRYNLIMSEFMKRYKFQGDYRLRLVFQKQFSQFVTNQHRIVIPVPVHQRTYQQRGFNQVKGLLNSNVHIINALTTIYNQKRVPQSHKSRADRLRLKQPFQIIKQQCSKIVKQDLVIVDDVYTTGTTLHHAAKVLMDTGAKSVIGITLAR